MTSTNRYGMMREMEYDLLDRITAKLKADFGKIEFLEIGVCGAGTVRGMYRRAAEIGCPVHCAGVDFESYRPNPPVAPNYDFYAGDSLEVWRKVKGEFNLLLVDGCHCVNHSMMDFHNYSPFVVVGGYCLFHDTAKGNTIGIKDYQPWTQDAFEQDHSFSNSWAHAGNSILGVREGLYKAGLVQGYRLDWKLIEEITNHEGTLMGMMLFQKTRPFV